MDKRLRLLAGEADALRRMFAGRQVRVGRSRNVHALTEARWAGDLTAPGPLCNVGIGGWDLSVMAPTSDTVSCRRCRRKLDAARQAPPRGVYQPPLPLAS